MLTIPSLHYSNTNNSTVECEVKSRALVGPPLVHGERPRSGWHREAWATIAASDDSVFDRIDVLGMREATVYLSAHAVRHGLTGGLPAEFDSPVSGRRSLGSRTSDRMCRVVVRAGP